MPRPLSYGSSRSFGSRPSRPWESWSVSLRFRRGIRQRYPILRPEQTTNLHLEAGGVLAQPGSMVWRFHDRNDIWRVSLAPNFVAIETTKYDSRTDFFIGFVTC